MEDSMEVPQKTKNRIIYDPAIPLLGIYPDRTVIQKDTCTPMFIAAVFTIAKTWKLPTCPSRRMDKDVVRIYNGILLNHNKEQNSIICNNMDAAGDYHTKWSKSERERQTLYDITYMWNLKHDPNEPIQETETDSQRTNLWLPGSRGRGRMDWDL